MHIICSKFIKPNTLFQKLIPSAIPNFTIAKISISHGGSFCFVSGSQGISVIEMPTRWGSDGIYQDGKAQITCKTINIHEHSLSQLEVVQARWHPSSPTDSHLLVLLSDNSLRIYDDGALKHVWRVGPLPTGNNLSYLKSLGDTAIDFDIAPAQVSNETTSPNNTFSLDNTADNKNTSFHSKRGHEQKKIEWPIVILRGNGSIVVLSAGFHTEKPRLQGPLTMIPSQKDNYGDESCSLIVIPTLPVTVVIAENSGVLHHALMIENQTNADGSFGDITKTVVPDDWSLYVVENIELELGLQESKKTESSACPLYLRRDPINEQRYFCYHDTGLHGITIGFVQELQKYTDDQTSEEEININVPSRVEYILSTKAFNNSKVNAVAGFGILQLPSGIFALLSVGQVVSLKTAKTMPPLIADYATQQPTIMDSKAGSDQQPSKIPFDQHIRMLLKSDVSQPILQLDKSKPPSSQEAFQLLMNSIQIMREKQFVRHDKVRQELIKRMKILSLMKNQQKDEIAQLFKNKAYIQEKACNLADMHEDIIERQQALQKRIQDISRISSLRMPAISSNEKEFIETIKKYKALVTKLSQDVKQIKAKNDSQSKSLEDWSKTNDNFTRASLPPKQEDTIKEFLGDMMRQIQGLKVDVQKVSNVIDY
jgi:nuclear pore complex protein Nup88